MFEYKILEMPLFRGYIFVIKNKSRKEAFQVKVNLTIVVENYKENL